MVHLLRFFFVFGWPFLLVVGLISIIRFSQFNTLEGDSGSNPALVFFTLACTMFFVGFVGIISLNTLDATEQVVGLMLILNTLILCPLALTFCFASILFFLSQNLTRK